MDQTYGERPVGTADRTIIAMFDDATAASRGMAELERAGIPRSSMSSHQATTGDASTARDDDESWWESIKRLFVPDEDAHTYREGIRRGGTIVVVHVPPALNDGVIDTLERCGAIDIDQRAQEWRSQGWTPGERVQAATPGLAPTAAGDTTREGTPAGETRIPIAREELRVGKRDVSAGHVRVRAYTVARPVTEHVALHHESVEIERRPATGTATDAAGDPFRERTVDLEETREEAVVSKDVRVEEELVVRKRTEEENQTVSDTVRETRVEVDDERSGQRPGQRPGRTTERSRG